VNSEVGSEGKTRSKEAAFSLLKRYRQELIAAARLVAIKLCVERGRTNSREVRDEMVKSALFVPNPAVGEYWIGAVFTPKYFERTGDRFRYQDDSRNLHTHEGVYWRIRQLPDWYSPAAKPTVMNDPTVEAKEQRPATKRARKPRNPSPKGQIDLF
jgi:hypothetical protein